MNIFRNDRVMLFAGLVFSFGYVSTTNAIGAELDNAKLLGKPYQAAAVTANDQSRVVYYRTSAEALGKGAANVYLDKEMVTALTPGGYSEFCVKPGQHTLGAYLGDAHRYQGKSTDLYRATLKGGTTYYLKVNEQGNTAPLVVGATVAEAELKGTREQVHLLNRASQIEACRS